MYGTINMSKLTAKKIQGKLKPGMHNDGAGLYLRVTSTGAKSWILRCRVHGMKRDIGLGGISWVSLAEARKKAAEMRAVARTGGDPLAERDRAKGIPTFEEAAQSVWREQVVPTARNEKHKAQWINTLRDYAFPIIGNRRVDVIRSGDILRVLQPIWLEKPETARRVRQRLRTVFDWSIAAQHREISNPLVGIEKALPKQGDKAKHHTALPYVELPGLMERLVRADGVGALAVRFAILTAARSGEVRGARWSEIDLVAAVWTIPAERMKDKEEYRIPLTVEALAVLKEARGLDDDLVFPGQRPRRPLSDMSLITVLKRLDVPVTVHGFRSSFRDWASERTNAPREIAEMCLAHTVGNAVERAYARSDIVEKRRDLMERWAGFCLSAGSKGKVVELRP
jgi:integrase